MSRIRAPDPLTPNSPNFVSSSAASSRSSPAAAAGDLRRWRRSPAVAVLSCGCGDELEAMNFMELAEDVQLTILSFLSAADVSALDATSLRSRSLCSPESRLWHALSRRRWGRLTHLHRWAPATASSFRNRTLYRSLTRCVHLVGFWHRIFSPSSPLLFFDWVPSFVAGSRLSPADDGGGYGVAKTPFLWMGVSPGGEPVNFLDPDRRIVDFAKVGEKWVFLNSPDLVPVHVNFVGRNHLVVEENLDYDDEGGKRRDDEAPLEVAMAEIYQYFANRSSPGGEEAKEEGEGEGEREVDEESVRV